MCVESIVNNLISKLFNVKKKISWKKKNKKKMKIIYGFLRNFQIYVALEKRLKLNQWSLSASAPGLSRSVVNAFMQLRVTVRWEKKERAEMKNENVNHQCVARDVIDNVLTEKRKRLLRVGWRGENRYRRTITSVHPHGWQQTMIERGILRQRKALISSQPRWEDDKNENKIDSREYL